ncbi:MAG: glutamate-5-semialdehyde dehydrogenase [Firmicutes bacterium]|nr:glutamate-5-semialdehyde dehydrogenase [Bacillota bacterium]
MDIKQLAKKAKEDSALLAAYSGEQRNAVLEAVAEALTLRKGEIFAANARDLEAAQRDGLPMSVTKRLKFDEQKLADVVASIRDLIDLPDPLFRTILKRELDDGLVLEQVTCPIGVIGVIFESRPDALVQIAALCIKSGNCALLKGGSEASNTNRALYNAIYQAGIETGFPRGFLTLAESREEINVLLQCDKEIDLIIPRGSNQFVRYIMENSRIPVMGHADGVCHIYVDSVFDVKKAIPVIMDAKTQYVSVCNAVETLLVHRDAAHVLLPALQVEAETYGAHGVELRGCSKTRQWIHCGEATEEDFKAEYLDYILAVKVVESLEEAITHINRYGSHHTDAIITEDEEAAAKFQMLVDSAGVYVNCSTRFADGYRYGFGAEVGVSTGKLHARGPVGLEGLVTYKYKLKGQGHVVGDYASGAKQFHFKNL